MNIPSIAKTKRFQLTLSAALSGVSGAAVGYIYAQRKFQKLYSEQAQADVNEIKEHYASNGFEKIRKEGDYSDPTAALQKIRGDRYDEKELEALAAYVEEVEPYTAYVEPDPAIDITMEQNVWQSLDPDTYFDWEEELPKREKKSIYVITKDEFFENERDYSQDTLTYFEGDDVLVDSKEQVVKDIGGTVDDENLYRFGHGSDDPNVVYIRCCDRDLEVEVLRSEGKYTEEVLGFIQHDDSPKIRKFRSDRE